MSFPITMPPSPAFQTFGWQIFDPTVVQESTFNSSSKKLDRFGAHWKASLALPPMSAEEGIAWSVFMTKMRGRTGSFFCWHPTRELARGTIAGAITCTATARARSVNLTGGTGTVLAGDFLQIGNDYVMIMEDVANIATDPVLIEPPLKHDQAGAAVIYNNPVGVFEFTTDENGWNVETARLYGFSLSIKESF